MTRMTRARQRREAMIVRPKWVMGIDLGTTNTCVAIWLPAELKSTLVYPEIRLDEYIEQLLSGGRDGGNAAGGIEDILINDAAIRRSVVRQIKKIKVVTTHQRSNRPFEVYGLTKEGADKLTFTERDGTLSTVQQYTEREFGLRLQRPGLPCAIRTSRCDGNLQMTFYPLELVRILPGQYLPGCGGPKRAPVIIHDLDGATDENGLLPSCVTYFDDGTNVVGVEALKNREDPEHRGNTVYDVKCLLGYTRVDLNTNGTLPPKVDGQDPDEDDDNRNSYWTYRLASVLYKPPMPHVELSFRERDGTMRKKYVTPVEVLSEILAKAKQMANEFMRRIGQIADDEELCHAVITVPAVFSQLQKNGVNMAAKRAGLVVMDKPTEPAAAAFAYGFDRHKYHNSQLLTFDFGGGTLDVNVVEVERSHLSVYAARGERLGGRHFDAAMFELVDDRIFYTPEVVIHDVSTYRQSLLGQCERMKQELTRQDETILELKNLDGIHLTDEDVKPIRISREEFEDYPKCQELIAKAMTIVQRTLDRTQLHASDIKQVLPIGGSSEMPMIRDAIEEFFHHDGRDGSVIINHSDVSDEFAFQAVAMGAAIRAAQLSSVHEELPDQRSMTEVVSMPIGVGFGKGAQLFYPIIKAGFRLPAPLEDVIPKSAKFRPMYKGKKRIAIKIFEGNSHLTAHNHLIGVFTLELDGDGKKVPEIELNAVMNSSGELRISARVGNYGKCEDHEIDYLEQRTVNQPPPPQDQQEIDEAEYDRLLASHRLHMALDAFAERKSKYLHPTAKEEDAFAVYHGVSKWFIENETTASLEKFIGASRDLRTARRMLNGKSRLRRDGSSSDGDESSSNEDDDVPSEDDYVEYNGPGRRKRNFSAEDENWAKRSKRDDEPGTSAEVQGGEDDENFLMVF